MDKNNQRRPRLGRASRSALRSADLGSASSNYCCIVPVQTATRTSNSCSLSRNCSTTVPLYLRILSPAMEGSSHRGGSLFLFRMFFEEVRSQWHCMRFMTGMTALIRLTCPDAYRGHHTDCRHHPVYAFRGHSIFRSWCRRVFKGRKAYEESIPTASAAQSFTREAEEGFRVKSTFNSLSLDSWLTWTRQCSMPSTHSAVIAYYATYSLLASLFLPVHKSLPQTELTRIVLPLIVVPWSTAIAVSRIWLGHHTVPQVLVGAAHGVVLAPLWFNLWLRIGDEYGGNLEKTYMIW